MLVLTRKLGEKIYVGNDICLTITRIEKGKVRIGIEAPRNMSIMREELLTEDDKQAIVRRMVTV